MKRSESITTLVKALTKAKSEYPTLLKDSDNEVIAIDNLSIGRLENIKEFSKSKKFTLICSDLSIRDKKWEIQFFGADNEYIRNYLRLVISL